MTGYIAYDAEGKPRGMGPTTQAAIADARHRGLAGGQGGRLRKATRERVAEAARLVPPPTAASSVHAESPAALPTPDEPPTSAYFSAVCRGDFATAKRLLARRDVETGRCRT